jgi:hypothetical protein
MKRYKIKAFKFGTHDYDVVVITAKDFDHLCLLAGKFCRKSVFYKEWVFIGEELNV